MYSVDVTSNKEYYIVLKDGKELYKISKASNQLKDIMELLKITVVK